MSMPLSIAYGRDIIARWTDSQFSQALQFEATRDADNAHYHHEAYKRGSLGHHIDVMGHRCALPPLAKPNGYVGYVAPAVGAVTISVGDVFPWVIAAQETPKGRRWHLVTREGHPYSTYALAHDVALVLLAQGIKP